jgi:hypothetical protein
MHADLERLIRLQSLDNELQALKRTVDTEADRRQALDAQLDTQRAALAHARDTLASIGHDRREVEKELAQVQGRLSRYRDQLMAVKTNKEYQAMQHEIAAAEGEVRRFEDRILELMMATDEATGVVKQAETDLKHAEADIRAAGSALVEEVARARDGVAAAARLREQVAASLPAALLSQYEALIERRGSAVVEARDGHCSVCHVRLRPKVFLDLRRNDAVIQCDSCQRILFFNPPPSHAPAPPAAS